MDGSARPDWWVEGWAVREAQKKSDTDAGERSTKRGSESLSSAQGTSAKAAHRGHQGSMQKRERELRELGSRRNSEGTLRVEGILLPVATFTRVAGFSNMKIRASGSVIFFSHSTRRHALH